MCSIEIRRHAKFQEPQAQPRSAGLNYLSFLPVESGKSYFPLDSEQKKKYYMLISGNRFTTEDTEAIWDTLCKSFGILVEGYRGGRA